MPYDLERGSVWVLEDSPLEAEMARRALAPDHDVELHADGAVMLERLSEGPVPDVIIVDWQLPGVSGLDVCKFVRAQHDASELPILMLTVQGRKDDVVEGLAAGANDYVTKPYDVAEVVARVGGLVRSSRLHRVQRARARELGLLAALGSALARSSVRPQVARQCAEALASHLDALVVELWTVPETAPVRIASVAHVSVELPMALARRVVAEGAPVLGADAAAELDGLPGQGFAGVPLVASGEVVGAILVLAARPLDAALGSLKLAADLLAAGVARARLEDERNASLTRESNARADAEAATRSKDEFLAMVSHELRTPLNAITGWSTLLLDGALPPDRQKRALQVIDRNARAQAQLIDDLLDISRITGGRMRIELTPVDVPAVALRALEAVKLACEAKNLAVEVLVDGDVGRVIGDAERLQQMIWNLLSNAIKFTPAGGRIRLSVESVGEMVEVSVEDSGQGIAPEFLPYVFDRFKQEDGSVTRPTGGLGLGLAIVRHLVELHGGEVAVHSDGLGKGARFTLRIPHDRHPREQPALRPPGREREGRSLAGVRIVVVDDEPDMRDLVQALFAEREAEVVVASSAGEAFDRVGETGPQLLVSDLAMPGEDGFSLIQRLRAKESREGTVRLPAVAVSAHARLEDRERALRAGFDAHVPKPLDIDSLFALVERLVFEA